MNYEALIARIEALERQVTLCQDIQEIEKLQRSYGYYMEHGMMEEVRDLFADSPDIAMYWLGLGEYHGQADVKGFWEKAFPSDMTHNPEYLHIIMQLSPIVHVNEDGLTAHGRWYGWDLWQFPRMVKFYTISGYILTKTIILKRMANGK